LPGGFRAFAGQVDFVERQLSQVRAAFEHRVGQALDDDQLRAGIRRANDVRRRLRAIRQLTFTAPACPLPALELLIAEMLAIHFCSDQQEAGRVLDDLLEETRRRVLAGTGVLPTGAARVYWVNPVADLRVMNLLEDLGGRVCGTEYMISHAIEPIPEDVPPMTALARMALADPMVGSPLERAERICAEALQWNCEAVVVSRIPGASHCALEAPMIADLVRSRLGVPVVDLEVPSLSDALEPALCNRLEALIETVRGLRNS
jgi:benzoyl-CoA reductase/2-hydroxyglutaryl-CoA dehydratase subunit BcrC/BadD/HgdB